MYRQGWLCLRVLGLSLRVRMRDNQRSTTNNESEQGRQHDAHFARIAASLADTGWDCLVDDETR
jgi:hypothetical protein